jgi:O-succinylbenzoic acid--CoA ligase
MLTYGNHWWSAVGSVLNLGLRDDDRWLAVLPLFHVGGLAILLRCVIYGIAAVVHETFDPAAVNRAVDEEGITIVSVVSAMLQRMLDERGERPYPPTLRCVLLGGGPAPRPLLEACARRGVPVVQTYGLTEAASQVATLAPADALRKLGSAGKPLFPTEVLVRRDGASAGPYEVGEILVRGPTVTPGYVNRPEDTAAAIRDGWLHTGDLGYLDHEGYLYLVDRRDDLIVSGGENVYPAEVEAALLAHPSVEEAGVVGIPDERWGQVPAAVVKPRAGARLDEEEVKAFCAERLARYKVPKRVWFVEALPRNAAGKLLRHVLRGWADEWRRSGG